MDTQRLYLKVCEQCGCQFESHFAVTRYCSARCRLEKCGKQERYLQFFRKKSKFEAREMRQQPCTELPVCIRVCVNI